MKPVMSCWEEKEDPVVNKGKAFALRIIRMYRYLITKNMKLFFPDGFYAAEPKSGRISEKLTEAGAIRIFIQN